MQINTTQSAALIDTNKDGSLREIRNPALKEALATNKDSGWNFASDSISGNAFNSLMVKAVKAADTSPTVKKAADAVAVAQKDLAEASQAREKQDNSIMNKVGQAGALGMMGGFFMAVFGLPTAGLAVVIAGAAASVAYLISNFFTDSKDTEVTNNLNMAKLKHEGALANMFKAYNEVNANKAVARATDPSAALEG